MRWSEFQIFGDPSRNSVCRVTNGVWLSYPGDAEMLSGVADPRVDSSNKVNTPNVTVLERLPEARPKPRPTPSSPP